MPRNRRPPKCAKRSTHEGRVTPHLWTMHTWINGELVSMRCSWCGVTRD